MSRQDINPKARGAPPQSGLHWFEVHFLRGLSPADVVRVLQPLAHRPSVGWWRKTPVVTFELRATADTVRWLVGFGPRLSEDLPSQLSTQLPGLTLVPVPNPPRPLAHAGADVKVSSNAKPLRTERGAGVTAGLLGTMNTLTKGEAAVVQWVVGPAQQQRIRPDEFNVARALGVRTAVQATADDRRLWKQKAAEPLFAVRGRIGARSARAGHAQSIVRQLGEALQLTNAASAELRVIRPTARTVRQLDHVTGFRWSGVLNIAELAAVLGWPVDGAGLLATAHGRQYPAPSAHLLPKEQRNQQSERVLGAGLHPSQANQLVTLPTESALHHVQVIGPTGSGKSTLLEQWTLADIRAGRSVFILEPRGDLVEAILAGVPAGRRKDVVIIEPTAAGEVVGFNPLAGSVAGAEQRADHLLHLFHELYGSSIGPRSSDVLLHAFIALARSRHGTLADLPVLLTNHGFRRRVLAEVNDLLVLAPFFSWYDSLSEAERQQVISPVLNKTRAFLSRTAIRRLLGQARPRFDLDELFQRPRIVLVNLNTGVIGAETAQLLGALLVTQLWQAMQRRALMPTTNRQPAMVVIDEVHNYLKLPVDLGDMFAQARGLGVGLTVAHQHLAQLSPKMRAGFNANARNRVVFHPSVEDAAPLAAVLGGGLVAGDLARLGAHEAYAEVLVDRRPSEPFLIRTLQPDSRTLSDPTDLRRASAQQYGVDGPGLDEELRQRWQGHSSTPDAPIGQVPRSQP